MNHINIFIDKIKHFESRNSQNFNMTMREAKDLHADITKLLLVLQELSPNAEAKPNPEQTINVELNGKDW
jgi:hypothetical protein